MTETNMSHINLSADTPEFFRLAGDQRQTWLTVLTTTAVHQEGMKFIHTYYAWIMAVPILALIWLIYYLSFHVRRPHMVFLNTKLNSLIVSGLPRLHHAYWPTFYVTHEIAQAAIGSFVRFDPKIKKDAGFQREIRQMKDGELIALDWLHGENMSDTTPIVFTCHGLAGHTDELNMQYLATGVRNAGMRFAIFNRRGCALDMKLTKLALYQWGCTSDMREILAYVKSRFPNAPLFGVGYSAGSNLLTKYLGETGVDSLVDVGLSVANSYDVKLTSEFLARKPFHSFVMVNILKNMLARNEDTFRKLEQMLEKEEVEHVRRVENGESPIDTNPSPSPSPSPILSPVSPSSLPGPPPLVRKLSLSRVKQVKNVMEWDQHFSLVTHRGYSDLDAFYAAQSTTPEMVLNIAVPLLNLHALDDPIVPDEILPKKELHANTNIIQCTTHRGGHLGYTEGFFPFNKPTWMESLTVEYFLLMAKPEIWKLVKQQRDDSRIKAKNEPLPPDVDEHREQKYDDRSAELSQQNGSFTLHPAPSRHSSRIGAVAPSTIASDTADASFGMDHRFPSRSRSRSRTTLLENDSKENNESNERSPFRSSNSSAALLPQDLSFFPSAASSSRSFHPRTFDLSELINSSPLPSPLVEDLLPDTPETILGRHRFAEPNTTEMTGEEDDSVAMEDIDDDTDRSATANFHRAAVSAPLATEMEFELTPISPAASPSKQPTRAKSASAAISQSPSKSNTTAAQRSSSTSTHLSSPIKRRKLDNDRVEVEEKHEDTRTDEQHESEHHTHANGKHTPSKRKK